MNGPWRCVENGAPADLGTLGGSSFPLIEPQSLRGRKPPTAPIVLNSRFFNGLRGTVRGGFSTPASTA